MVFILKEDEPPADRRGAQMKAPSERAPRGKYAGGVLEEKYKKNSGWCGKPNYRARRQPVSVPLGRKVLLRELSEIRYS